MINIDSVGRGDNLGLVSLHGRLFPIHSSSSLNRLIRSVDPSLSDIQHYHRAGDYLPFCKAGYYSSSLEATWQGGTPPEYHTTGDLATSINEEIISREYQTLAGTITLLNKRTFEL